MAQGPRPKRKAGLAGGDQTCFLLLDWLGGEPVCMNHTLSAGSLSIPVFAWFLDFSQA